MMFVYSGFVWLISLGMIVAGRGYIQLAKRMRGFRTTRARILARKLSIVSQTTEGHWGKGGGYQPTPTYEYVVDGVTYTSDKASYALKGRKQSVGGSGPGRDPGRDRRPLRPGVPGRGLPRAPHAAARLLADRGRDHRRADRADHAGPGLGGGAASTTVSAAPTSGST